MIGTAHFLVSGRVQGVWYRAWAREQALALGLCGFARNLAGGDVEVIAQGESAALAAFERALRKGPPLARVLWVQRQAMESASAYRNFETF